MRAVMAITAVLLLGAAGLIFAWCMVVLVEMLSGVVTGLVQTR